MPPQGSPGLVQKRKTEHTYLYCLVEIKQIRGYYEQPYVSKLKILDE